MSAPPAHRRRVLFVDDNAQFLETLQPLMEELSGGSWEVLTAESANRAFTILQQSSADLVVLDVEMSVVDGIQLLALVNRGYPQTQKAVLTGLPNEQNRAACVANGADLFLAKPTTREGWHSLYTALNELLRFQPEQGFRGVLRRGGLQDLIQMECLSRNSSVVAISDGRQPGEIWIEEGRIVHAQVGPLSGETAFNHLLQLRGGQFNLKPFSVPPERTLEGPWEFLLTGAARKRAELQSSGDQPNPAMPVTATHPTAQAQTKVETSPGLAEAGERRVPTQPRPAIESMLVCSAQGEVLHEWQVKGRTAWVGFFEFLSQRSQRLSQGLNLGEFDRLEIQTAKSRMIVLITPEGGTLVGVVKAQAALAAVPQMTVAAGKEPLIAWMRQQAPVAGEYLRALRFADRTYICDHESVQFPRSTSEPAWRFVADAFHLLHADGVGAERLSWLYQTASLHCARRADETFLEVLTASGPDKVDAIGLDRLLEEFLRARPA